MTTMTGSTSLTLRSRRQRVGLVLAGLLSAANTLSVVGGPTPEGEVGPPMVVLLAGTVLGVVGLLAVVVAWRSDNRAALRVAAGALIISALTAVPALFVDIPAALKIVAAVGVLLTIAAVVLMFSAEHRPASLSD
jgi:hypothetical protein